MGQLPSERVTPDIVYDKLGVDYAGPVYIKLGAMRRPTIVKAYVAVFVSLSVKAVHFEAVSDSTSEAFLACLRRFVARRGNPTLIWSDHGTNFVGAACLLVELYQFLRQRVTEEVITDFCTSQGITWNFIPERAPHFGGLWEAVPNGDVLRRRLPLVEVLQRYSLMTIVAKSAGLELDKDAIVAGQKWADEREGGSGIASSGLPIKK